MKIVDLLKVESIDLKAQPKDKAAALEHLITLMERGGNLLDKDEYRACVLRREEEVPLVIREHARKYQFIVTHGMLWQRER